MTALRRRMIEDMRVRNLAANTQRVYLQYVRAYAEHFGRSPALLGPEEIRAWQLHLIEAHRSRSTLVVATAALRFLYNVTLKRHLAIEEIVMSKQPRKLPVILSPDEVARFLEAIRSVKYRAGPDDGLRRGLADLGSDPPEGHRHRQSAHGAARRAGQGACRPLRHAFAAAAGDPAQLLVRWPTAALAVPRPLPRSAHRPQYPETRLP